MDPKVEYALRLGDNALILGQRLAEWLGHAPVLEEDIASANISLDLVGQARLWLTFAGTLEGQGRDEDRLAYHREQHQFRNFTLLELPNGDYAQTIVRRFLFDAWHCLALGALSRSKDTDIAAIAAGLLAGKPIPAKIEVRPAKLGTAKYVSKDDPKLWGWVIFPPGFEAPAMMDLAKRQAWTLKPAVLRAAK